MTQVFIRAPEQSSGLNNKLITAISVAVTALTGILAFAAFLVPLNG